MKKVFFILICFTIQHIAAQESELYKKTAATFQENFNAQQIDAIFDMYTSEMQEAMTKEGVSRFVNGCFEQFGSLTNLAYIETAEGIHSYTATFEKISLVMDLQLSENGKISTIQFQEP